jgi:hypothetical protein
MKNENTVFTDDSQDLVAIPDQIVDEMLEVAEKRLQSIKRVKEFALTLTSQQDWADLGGKPYLMAAGAEKVARVFGVNIKLKTPAYEKITGTDAKGAFYIYLFHGTASLAGGDKIDVIGTCSSRDKFFASKDGKLKPLSEIDEPNIMKKAYNNLMVNGITRLIGLRNMSWDEVKAGISSQGKATKVDYHSRKAETDKDVEKSKNEMIARIDRLLIQFFGKDQDSMKEALHFATDYKGLPKADTTADFYSRQVRRRLW